MRGLVKALPHLGLKIYRYHTWSTSYTYGFDSLHMQGMYPYSKCRDRPWGPSILQFNGTGRGVFVWG